MKPSRIQSITARVAAKIALSAALAFMSGAAMASDPMSQLLERAMTESWAKFEAREEALLDKDKFTVVLCGTGNPASRARVQSCTAVFVNGKFFVFDAGDGAVASMETLGLPLTRLTAVMLTHFHSDHYDDLAETIDRSFILGRQTHLPVVGGEGIEEIVEGIRQSYRLEFSYRTGHHGEKVMPAKAAQAFEAQTVRFNSSQEGAVVYDQDGVKVTAFMVDHAPIRPAMGYRVDYAGKSVVISGDTSDTPNLHKFSKGADVLVTEVMNNSLVAKMEKIERKLGHERRAKIYLDIRDSYHLGTDEVGKLAQGAGVKTVMLTHLIPSFKNDDLMNRYYKDEIAKVYKGKILVGKDGMEFIIP